jgi:hypothetical protein
MRCLLIFAAAASLTACTGSPRFWEKEGATPEVTSSDLVECRRAARREAFFETGYYGFGGFSRFGPFPYYGYRRGPFFARSRYFWGGPDVQFDQEVRLTAFCMRNKGYELVPVTPAPTTVAPGTIPALTPDAAHPTPKTD